MNKKFNRAISLVALSVVSTFSVANDRCSDVLIGAIETYSLDHQYGYDSNIQDAMCSEELRKKIKSSNGNSGVSFLNIISASLDGHYNSEEEYINRRCSQYSKQLSFSEATKLLSRSTSTDTINAWKNCMNSNSKPLTCSVSKVNYHDKTAQLSIHYLGNNGPATEIEATVDNGRVVGGVRQTFKQNHSYDKTIIIDDVTQPTLINITGNGTYIDLNCNATIPARPATPQKEKLGLCEIVRKKALNDYDISYHQYMYYKSENMVPIFPSKSDHSRVMGIDCEFYTKMSGQ